MADIELVIKIPEEKYQGILNMAEEILDAGTFCSPRYLYKAVLNGEPLPKGHGDLKDFQKIYADMTEIVELARQRVIDTPTNSPCYMRYVSQLNERTAFKEMLFDAPTIIKADEEQEE